MSEHRARKRFGQHFLHDRGVVHHILDAFRPRPGEIVVEIGPGLGALTRPLLDRIPHLHVVELDRDLAARLRAEFPPERLTVHEVDALRFDFRQLATGEAPLRVIGNLPYNISTPLLFHLLDQMKCDAQGRASAERGRMPRTAIHDMLFMLQKEVVRRLAAAPGGKDYGRLSVMIQAQLQVEALFDVGSGAFSPPPRVDSAIVRLTPHAAPPAPISDPVVFAQLVKAAFAQRRKTLHNNLKGLLADDTMTTLGIDPERRAETLSLAEFAALANALPPAA